MDAVVMFGLFLILAMLAGTIEFPLADRADPSDHTFTPVPEWYFLFFYQFLKYMSGPLEPLATWGLPILVILGLLLLPFLDRNPERRPSSRPTALLAGLIFLMTIFTLLAISIRDLHTLPKLDPSIARGKSLFAQNHCMACHALHGEGGKVGPDLSYAGNRRTDRDWHIRHLRDPASVSLGSIMPKFPLTDREMNDLASYLLSLKGEAIAPTEGTLETDETEYAALPHVGVALSCRACPEASERKEQI